MVDNVPHIRAQTRERITESQSKQKRKHDAKLRKILNFNIGDKVLYYDAAKEKQWSGKLNPK